MALKATWITHTEEAVDNEVKLEVEEAVQTTGYLSYAEERKLLRKVDFHLMPLLITLYLLKNLDSNNVSYMPTLNSGTDTNILKELNMTKDQWAWVSTAFFIPFSLLEVPSTLLLKKSTPRVHQFRISLLWGITTACHAAVKNRHQLYAARFFLGLFEAGLYPAQLAQLVYWYRPDEVTTRMAFLGVLGSFSNILTAFIAYGFSFASGDRGLSAWQWIFLSEGLLTVVVSVFMLFYLPNFPDTATWLTPQERAYLLDRLPPSAPKSTDKNFDAGAIWRALKKPTTLLFAALRLFQNLGTYGLGFWLPSIIQSFGITSPSTTPLMTAPSAAASVISGIAFSYAVDRAKVKPHIIVIVSLLVALISFCILAFVKNKVVLYVFIIVATIATSADGSTFSSWMTQILKGSTEVTFSLGLVNGIAQLGGIIGPQLFRAKYAPRYTVPYCVCLGFIAAGVVVTVILWRLTGAVIDKTFRDKKERLRERSADWDQKPVYNQGNGTVNVIVKDVESSDKV